MHMQSPCHLSERTEENHHSDATLEIFAQFIQFNSNCFILRLNIYINTFVLPAGSPPLDDIV